MVPQVTIIGILMIVNGSLTVLLGILYAVMGPVMFSLMGRQNAGAAAPPPEVQQIFTWVSIGYVVAGSVVAIAGLMNIAGGISALKFRSRAFVITALFFNILPMFTCYCTVTSLGLMIWGLIVMFQGDVAHAFSLGASGYTADEIKRRMAEREDYRRDRYRDDYDSRRDDEDRPRKRRAAEDESEPPPRKRPAPPGGEDDDRIREQ